MDEQEQLGLEMDTPPAEGEEELSEYLLTSFEDPSAINFQSGPSSSSGMPGGNYIIKF